LFCRGLLELAWRPGVCRRIVSLVVSGMRHRPLGGSGVDVSVLALGSWRTYERIGRDEGIAVIRTARERGVTFLDDAR
jgi:hypothetical protein